MITAWRLARTPYADLSGEGARLHGGRWNSPGLPMVYLAEHPALAVLEVRVHLDLPPDLLPDDYVLAQVELPDEPPEILPDMPAGPCAAGDAWLRANRTAVLRVPSAFVPGAANLLLNPRHPRAAKARLVLTRPFRFDPRLFAAAPTPPAPAARGG